MGKNRDGNTNLWQVLCFCLLFAGVASVCPHDAFDLLHEYDVIVVGSGIGGSVTARKLAEQNPEWNVLVVERGISWDQCRTCSDPGAGLTAFFDHTTGPMINTVPQEGSFSKKVLIKDTMVQGGSSSLNLMYHIRCDSENYFNLHWPSSWNWTSIKPYIKRYENFLSTDSSFDYEKNYRANSGLVKITQANLEYGNGFLKRGLEKIKVIYPNIPVYTNNSLNNEGLNGTGAAPIEFFATHDLRSSATITYIKSYTGKNLKVITQVRVNKILFNGTTATGVELQLVRDGRGHSSTCIIKATRAVIVSAGALGSPKLLKLSGIGPRAELEALGIPVVVANDEVGAKLNDHVMAVAICKFAPPNNIPYASGYPNSFASVYWNSDDDPNARPNFWMSLFSEYMFDMNFGVLQTTLLNTNSFGTVKLASASPDDPPVVDPKYFSDATDKNNFAKGYAKSFAFAHELGCEPVYDYCQKGACKNDTDRLDKYLAEGHNAPGYHFAGSCGVGRVVDEDTFAVIGTQKLFVVDASALPYSPPGNPSSILYMVSERVSDRINEVLRKTVMHNGEVTFPPYSYVEGGKTLIKVYPNQPSIYSFKILAVSSQGTPRTSGGDIAKVSVASSLFMPIKTEVKIADLQNGTYQVDVTVGANMVGVVNLNVFLNYKPIMHGSMSFVVALA